MTVVISNTASGKARAALYEKGRQSITLTIEKLDGRTLGAMIAYSATGVGFYIAGEYRLRITRPSVEPGKKAATAIPPNCRAKSWHLILFEAASAEQIWKPHG